ncbi:glycosyltransferase [Breoghania sp. JC706]|uniref:glycosyltransferase n=1 Tax=Breoghania sp. JC706 TaxID=3117732 RepID=UPI0030095042
MVIPKKRIFFVVPNYRQVGGIAKMLDYAVHADPERYEVWFATLSNQHAKAGLTAKPYYQRAQHDIQFTLLNDADLRDGDLVMISLPSNFYRVLERAKALGYPDIRFIHLIQNVRHNNMFFDRGAARDLLMKNMLRICITDQVYDAVKELVPDENLMELNFHGFDFEFFRRPAIRANPRLRLGYNLFKSNFGERVREACEAKGLPVEFEVVPRGVSWENLRAAYHACDAFIGTPLREEGYYLPGIEALAGGDVLICSDAVGNRSYLAADAAWTVGYEDVDDYVAKIEQLLAMAPEDRERLQASAVDFASQFSLEMEKQGFRSFLEKHVAE